MRYALTQTAFAVLALALAVVTFAHLWLRAWS
jgi:hypothetical protein